MRYLTVKKFASESGYTEDAVRSKIRDGIWRLGEIWKKAPDGRTLIDVEGMKHG
ncbi:excisionase [Pseudomonas aeruginosa]|uniref:excisionase n=1 Tax=Pseudomonas aeruginosa TaxID=287 RepID=UPI001E41A35A|nr:excisionase [Pseudomonas aeruginosa]